MIALMILSGGLLTMASVQLQSIKGGQRGRHFTMASTIAASQIERLQRQSWGNVAVTNWTAAVSSQAILARTEADLDYSLQWRIADLVASKTRTIDVRVSWIEQSGQNRSLTMSSIRHNHEAL
jgi:Tfp pilus assembly protein PilV